MRTFALLVLLLFTPLQGLLLFCPFELEAEVAAHHHAPDSNAPGSCADDRESGVHVDHHDSGAHHHEHDAGQECVAMACGASVATSRDVAPAWGDFHRAPAEATFGDAPIAALTPEDPPPPRHT